MIECVIEAKMNEAKANAKVGVLFLAIIVIISRYATVWEPEYIVLYLLLQKE